MKVLLIIFLVLLIIGGAAGYYFFVYKKQNQSCPTAIKSLTLCATEREINSLSDIKCEDGSTLSDLKLKNGGKCESENFDKPLDADAVSGPGSAIFSGCSTGDYVRGYKVDDKLGIVFTC
jgi:hypothetical protein